MRRVLLGALLLLVVAPAGAQEAGDAQTFFRDAILDDAKTKPGVKQLLDSGRGFVEPAPVFADVTGDGKADAVVRVMSGGAGGAIAVYVFSTDGKKSKKLRVVYRNGSLYRATVKLNAGRNVVIRTPVYAPGDELSDPSQARDRTYAWSAKAKTFKRVSSVVFDLT